MLLQHWSYQLCCRFIVSIYHNNLCDIALVYLLCFSRACLKNNMYFAHLWCFATYLNVKFPHFFGWGILNIWCFVREKHLLFYHNWCLALFLYTELAEEFNIETIFLKLWNWGWEMHDTEFWIMTTAVVHPSVESDLHKVQCTSLHPGPGDPVQHYRIQTKLKPCFSTILKTG